MITRFLGCLWLCLILSLSAALVFAAPTGLSLLAGKGTQQTDATTGRYDFGTRRLSDASPLEHTFTLQNNSTVPVTIDRLQSSCGCTTAFLADDQSLPLTVGPGGIVPVHVSIAPHRLAPGAVSKSVWVYTHGPAEASVLLEITGTMQDDYVPPVPQTPVPVPVNGSAKPRLDYPAPLFTLPDMQGTSFALKSVQGRRVSLFFFCGCPWCADVAQAWSRTQRRRNFSSDVQTIVVFAGSAAATRDFAGKNGLDLKRTILVPDSDSKLTESVYKLNSCPRVFVLDTAGLIRYTNDHADDQPRVAPAKTIVGHTLAALEQIAPSGSKH